MSWDTHYKNRLMTADEALRCVAIGDAGVHPARVRRAGNPGRGAACGALLVCEDVEIVHMMTMGAAPYVAPEMAGHFRHNAMFIGGNVREAINEGRADYTPDLPERD